MNFLRTSFFGDVVILGSCLAFDMLQIWNATFLSLGVGCHILLVKKRLKKPSELLVTISVVCAILKKKQMSC